MMVSCNSKVETWCHIITKSKHADVIKGVSKKCWLGNCLCFYHCVLNFNASKSIFSVQVDGCNISRNLGNNLSDSVHCFWAIAHGIKKKNSKKYNSTRGSWKDHYGFLSLPEIFWRAKMAWKTCYV